MFSVHRLNIASVKFAVALNPPTFEVNHSNVYASVAISEREVILIDADVRFGHTYIDKQFEPVRNSLVQLLKNWDLLQADVKHIINSHLYFDHCCNSQLFSKAKIIVQA